MELTFYGAAREVTGSCYCLGSNNRKILVDCGMHQGKDEEKDPGLPFSADAIDSVILTHAHIDHSGRLPLLVKEGFKGKIYAIEATCDLLSILLKDSAKIQEMEANWENRKNKRAGKKEKKPMYSMHDVEKTLKLLQPCSYQHLYDITKGVKLNFVDAGHILGSASVELFLQEGEVEKKVVFSGDIGNVDQPIIKDPQYISKTDFVIMEATYGDRNHEENSDHTLELARIIEKTISRGGNVIIPSFAVGRTQGLLYLLREIKEKNMMKRGSDFPVYVDSPLATEATRLYDDDLNIYGDLQTKKIVNKGLNPLYFPDLHFTESTSESKALNYDPIPKVIISSSGMCEGGRIKHHLKHNLWKKKCSLVFVGYQAEETLGRQLLEGAKEVEIYHDKVAVRAEIHNFTGLSAHADKDGLIKWITSFENKPVKVFVAHGERLVCENFVESLDKLGFNALAPFYKDVYDLKTGEKSISGTGKPGKKGQNEKGYSDLMKAFERLSQVIHDKETSKNSDMEKITKDIRRITDKLEKYR